MPRRIGLFSMVAILLSLACRALGQPAEIETLRREADLERQGKIEFLQRQRPLAGAQATAQRGQQAGFDVGYYGLTFTIQPAAALLTGAVEVRGKALRPGLAEVVLDLVATMMVDSVSGGASSFSHDGDALTIRLPAPLAAGQPFAFTIHYHGQPQSSGFGGFVFDNRNGRPHIWTLSEPYFAHTWWPCKDLPNDKADSLDVTVTLPEDLKVASNGLLRSQTTNGDGTATFHWHESYPIATYLVSLAIADYVNFTQTADLGDAGVLTLRHYIFTDQLDGARGQLATLPDMIEYFNDIFGPYPFAGEKYGIAQFQWGGGMEHQTMTSQGGFGESLNVHELAHQWWGDMTTNANWHEIWINEGFAAYSEALYFEHARGAAFYHLYMQGKDREYAGSIYREDTTNVSQLFNRIIYDKGAWVLHMLRHVVGDSTFFEILQAYAGDPQLKYGNTSTARFRAVCERVAGRNLGWFFDPWIYGTGRPIYRYNWQVQPDGNRYIVRINIEQTQAPTSQVFVMPIDFLLVEAVQDTVVTVFNDQAQQSFFIDLPFAPAAVALDVDNWILKRAEQGPTTPIAERGELPATLSLLPNYPNPFNAGTTINFDLPVAQFVEVAIFSLAGERLTTLAAREYSAGSHRLRWHGTDAAGRVAASGVYIVRVKTASAAAVQKMTLLR